MQIRAFVIKKESLNNNINVNENPAETFTQFLK